MTRSQGGDRCYHIDPAALPDADDMTAEAPWERGLSGPERLSRWLTRVGAKPVDVNRGLDDATLAQNPPPDLYHLEGSNFFRGLALIDLPEAMLKRAFGPGAAYTTTLCFIASNRNTGSSPSSTTRSTSSGKGWNRRLPSRAATVRSSPS